MLVYPAQNSSFARAAAQYREVLCDTATFDTRTIEELIATPNALDAATVTALRERYTW